MAVSRNIKRPPASRAARAIGAEGTPRSRRHRGTRHRYHFGAPTLIYMFVSLLLALGAFNSQNNLLFWALGFAFAAMIVSGLLSGRMLMGLRAVRLNSPAGHVGDPIEPGYRVLNSNRLVPGFALSVRDLSVPEPAPLAAARRQTRSAVSRPLATIVKTGFVQHVAPRGHTDCAASVRALRRGVIKLRHVRIETSFPFGLIRKAIDFEVRGELVIWPRLIRLNPAVLNGTMQAGTSPRAPSRRRGDGEDFFSLREYVEGDSPRSIAWRVSAQRMSSGSPDHAGLFVKQTLAPSPSRVWIVLDLGRDAEFNERAISVGVSLAKAALDLGMMFALSEPISGLLVPPGTGRGHLERLFDAAARLELPDSESNSVAEAVRLPGKSATSQGTFCVVVHARAPDAEVAGFYAGLGRVTHITADDPAILDPSELDQDGRANTAEEAPSKRQDVAGAGAPR